MEMKISLWWAKLLMAVLVPVKSCAVFDWFLFTLLFQKRLAIYKVMWP